MQDFSGLNEFNFLKAKILNFMEYKMSIMNSSCYIMTVDGPLLESSIFIFDDKEFKVKNFEKLQGIKVINVSDQRYGDYLVALDSDRQLIAMDLSLLVKGIAPCKIDGYNSRQEQENNSAILSADQ